MAVGSLEWARRTGGRLGGADRLRLLAQAIAARAEAAFRRPAATATDIGALRVPDTPLARACAEHLAAAAEPWVVNHSWRTYAWGFLLGAGEGRAFDEEELLAAALLHDLRLTGPASPADHCFAVEGAFAAEECLAAHGVAEDRRRRVAEAICLHMNVRVAPAWGAEAHLLHEGAAADVVGARVGEIAASTRRAVLDRHPRLGMKTALAGAMTRQAALRPASRAAFLCRMGFVAMIRRAPFEDTP